MKNFEAGSFLTQRDYSNSNSDRNLLGLVAVLCIGALSVFVLKLAGAI